MQTLNSDTRVQIIKLCNITQTLFSINDKEYLLLLEATWMSSTVENFSLSISCVVNLNPGVKSVIANRLKAVTE